MSPSRLPYIAYNILIHILSLNKMTWAFFVNFSIGLISTRFGTIKVFNTLDYLFQSLKNDYRTISKNSI